MADAHLWACSDCGNVYATDLAIEDELPDECGICGATGYKRVGSASR